jgi:general secretion pathway protein K
MKEEKGIALIITLWVLTILSVVAFSFAYLARLEMKIAGYERTRLIALGLARAGIERGIEELTRDINNYDAFDEEWREKFVDEEGVLREIEIEDNQGKIVGTYTLRISDEEGKINLNYGDELKKERILGELLQVLDIEGKEVIRDSILDWIDPDNLHRIQGAEDSYYQGLDTPYDCKDGPLDILEELFLIRGVTPQLFREKQLSNFLTVHSQGQININTASKEVLQAALEIEQGLAEQIIDYRQVQPFQNVNEIFQVPGMTKELNPRSTLERQQSIPTNVRKMFSQITVKSANFTLESKGTLRESKIGRRVVAIVRRGTPLRIKYWKEE